MRYINVTNAAPDAGWLTEAARVSAELEAAPNKAERDKIIDQNSAVWTQLKPWLLAFSKGKCWFSEARDTFSHWEVEHYRPKKVARGLNGKSRHDGYWWLAFDWKNFRICGNVGNRKKGGYFPLKAGTDRATAANRNTDDEFPYLLDPTRPEDPLMLCFDENGDVKPMPDLDGWNTLRAEESIKRYKLRGHEPLMEARRDIWARCLREVNFCQNLMEEQSKAPSATKREQIKNQMEKLIEMAKFESEFSSVAADCLRNHSAKWAQKLAAQAV